jgi:hypothetical protein
MKKRIILFLTISLALLSSCKKDKIENECLTVPPEEECQDIPPPEGWTTGGHQWTKVLPYYETPHFNPNNSNELVFRLYENTGDQFFLLVKYNFSTQEKETIFQGDFAFPKWSKKDWILFSQSDFNIYKIKSNGDSLTQLTFSGNNYASEWNFNGDKFLHAVIGGGSIIRNEEGIALDTILNTGGRPSWQHDSLIIAAQFSGVTVIDPDISTYRYVQREDTTSGITSAEWIDYENAVFGNNNGIFSVNINSGVFSQLVNSCDAKVYQYPTVSRISNKVVFQRTDKELIETEVNKGTATSRMFMMNFDGSEREEIILPL